MKTIQRLISFIFILSLTVIRLYGEDICNNGVVLVSGTIREDGKARVTHIFNISGTPGNQASTSATITLKNDDDKRQSFRLESGERLDVDVTCTSIRCNTANGGGIIWRAKKKPIPPNPPIPNPIPAPKPTPTPTPNPSPTPSPKPLQPISKAQLIGDFIKFLDDEDDKYYSLGTIQTEKEDIQGHVKNIDGYADKRAYIREQKLISKINTDSTTILQKKASEDSLIAIFFKTYASGRIIEDSIACTDSLKLILEDRLSQKEANLKILSEVINSISESNPTWWDKNKSLVIASSIAILLVLVIVIWIIASKRKGKNKHVNIGSQQAMQPASADIVIRKKSETVFRKQSLEDVKENSAYLKINSSEFCDDSAIRDIYIKNTCIKDIYNMYAEDLRNPNNPKEDGCMVLGRWVFDQDHGVYDVSLEEIVQPGDDAVFAEYELNFGGKIQLKRSERLKRLRRDTDLQYDLTCWVHSHPGLGVFFSNSDNNVQMQLKHPVHPNFLTAIVIDILTPQQELGIFTFKRDSSITSKADLKKMYSLEELYKWAIDSNRSSFKPEDYYNVLDKSRKHDQGCLGIELGNGAVIDMGMLITEQEIGFVGKVHGFKHVQSAAVEYVVTSVSRNEVVPDNELLGCFIIATRCSIPSIKKLVGAYIDKIHFILVYTPTDGLLTSIPVLNQEICTDEDFYGEQTLEDLKIWTRRKR